MTADRSDPSKAAAVVVFDLDGTLSDPIEGIAACVDHALRECELPSVTRAQVEQWVGPPLDELLVGVSGVTDQATLVRLIAAYRQRYTSDGWAECRPYPGVSAGLAELGAAGIAMGLCTSKREDFARQVLELQGISEHFDFVSGGDVGVPKADQLQSLLAEGRITADSVMVGDRAVDLAAARANGLRGVGVLWGYGSTDELSALRPLAILEDPSQLGSLAGLALRCA